MSVGQDRVTVFEIALRRNKVLQRCQRRPAMKAATIHYLPLTVHGFTILCCSDFPTNAEYVHVVVAMSLRADERKKMKRGTFPPATQHAEQRYRKD